MRRFMLFATICLLLTGLFAAPASAQCAGTPGATNPLLLLQGTSWGFRLEGSVVSGNIPVAAIGRFTATVAPNPRTPSVIQGTLLTTETVNFGGTVQPILAQVAGTFQVDSDCNGGVLMLGPGFPPGFRDLRFVLTAGGTMYLVNTDNDGVVVSGSARRAGAPTVVVLE
jgi:hypothetical protein